MNDNSSVSEFLPVKSIESHLTHHHKEAHKGMKQQQSHSCPFASLTEREVDPLERVSCSSQTQLMHLNSRMHTLSLDVPLLSPYIICGPTQTRHLRKSVHHKCCGSELYSNVTHCCCEVDNALKIHLKNSPCCPLQPGVLTR